MQATMKTIAMIISLGTASFGQGQPLLEEKAAGWASLSGGTTGGSGGKVVEVSTFSALQEAAKASGKAVILVKGAMSGRLSISADKTVFGLPGAVLTGGIDIKGVTNVILRNLKVEGPGSVDVDGVDCITVQECSRIWLDHLDVSDGQDGNMDITNGADLVTVSWTRFTYTSKSKNHQFSNLIGSSDSRTTDRGKLRVTMHHNWWGDGVKERMPRVRFGKVHVVNNLFNSAVADYCVRAGIEADILVEGNAFIGVNEPIDFFENDFKAITERGNLFTGTKGNTQGKGTAFTPDYAMKIDAAADMEARIKGPHGAGATLPDPRTPGSTALAYPSGSARKAGTVFLYRGMVLKPDMFVGRQFPRP